MAAFSIDPESFLTKMNFKIFLFILLTMGLGESHAYKHNYSSPASSSAYRNWTNSTSTPSTAIGVNLKPDQYDLSNPSASLEQSKVHILETRASSAISTANSHEASTLPSSLMNEHTKIQSNLAVTASSTGSAFFFDNTSSKLDLPSGTVLHSNLTTSASPNKHHGQNEACKSYVPGTIALNSSLLTEEGLSKQCLLWDDSCSGCVSRAEDMFFNYTLNYARKCFAKKPSAEAAGLCDAWHRGYNMSKLERWMRGPQCLSSSSIWDKHPKPHTEPGYVKVDTCCGRCRAHGKNTVEIYYWPSPDADYSCLSIVNNKQHPIDMGATTTTRTLSSSYELITFWGCTLSTPDKKGNTVTTTAVMTTWSGPAFKAPRANPWDPPGCVGVSKPHANQNDSRISPPSITQADTELPVTAIVEGYTLTSPSVYARFHNVSLADYCGDLLTITETMLGFAPGRLSTIATPLRRFEEFIHATYLPFEPFDPADLPCPPMSVMRKAWYSPEPWVPYRPVFALPYEISTLNENLAQCSNIKFGALDPPIALIPQSALVPSVQGGESLVRPEATTTTNQLASPEASPVPGATLEQGAVKTSAPKQSLKSFNKDSSTSYPPDTDKQNPHDTNTVESDNGGGSGPPVSHYNMNHVPEGAPETGKAGSSSGASLVNGEVHNVESKQDQSHVHDNSVASSKPDPNNSNAEKGAPNIDAIPSKSAVQNDLPEQGSKPFNDNSPASSKKDPDVEKDVHSNDNVIEKDDFNGISSVFSKYGVTLTAGGAPAIITTGSIPGHKKPLTLSLDSNGNLLYNAEGDTASPFSWDGESSNNAMQPPSEPLTTSILNNQPLVVLPNGQGVSVVGTTLYPISLLGNLPAATAKGKHPNILLSGTSISLLGTSALVLGGSVTVKLPTPTTAEPVPSTVTDSARFFRSESPAGDQASPATDSFPGNSSNNGSADPRMGQVIQGPESFTGSALSVTSSLLNSQHVLIIALILTILILSINFREH